MTSAGRRGGNGLGLSIAAGTRAYTPPPWTCRRFETAVSAARVRRRKTAAVPDVIGMTAPDALGILTRAGLDAVSATPGIELQEQPGELRPTVVVRQYPDPGVKVPTASTIRLWLERGDGEGGVREPRRPPPPPREAWGERTREAIG